MGGQTPGLTKTRGISPLDAVCAGEISRMRARGISTMRPSSAAGQVSIIRYIPGPLQTGTPKWILVRPSESQSTTRSTTGDELLMYANL